MKFLGSVRKTTPIFDVRGRAGDRLWTIAEMAVARVGGRSLGWFCRHCGTGATRGNLYLGPPRGAQLPQDRAKRAPGSGGCTDGLCTSPWRLLVGGPRRTGPPGRRVARPVRCGRAPPPATEAAGATEDVPALRGEVPAWSSRCRQGHGEIPQRLCRERARWARQLAQARVSRGGRRLQLGIQAPVRPSN
jgi:hypothetical protein